MVLRRELGRSLHCDVADAAAFEAAAEAECGPLNMWIKAAVVTGLGPAIEMTSEEHERVMDVIQAFTVNGTLAVLRRMRRA